jgi:peptidyl-prolyl cis-trans isomerase C
MRILPGLFVGAFIASTVIAATTTATRVAAEPGTTVIARVGDATITAADLERRLKAMRRNRLIGFGTTPDEVRRNVLVKILIPEVLYAQEAKARGFANSPRVRDRVQSILRESVQNQLREQLRRPGAVTPEEVRAYYEANLANFQTPERVQIWRILVDTDEEARAVLAEAKADKSVQRWRELAQKHSKDEATKMRRGELGFVMPDGRTNRPRVRVDPALFVAANALKNGEIAPEPVVEGKQFAVIWRRGAVPAVNRSLKQESHLIRQILTRSKLKDRLLAILDQLRKDQLKDVNTPLLEYVKIDMGDSLGGPKAPVKRHKPDANPEPAAGERGLR